MILPSRLRFRRGRRIRIPTPTFTLLTQDFRLISFLNYYIRHFRALVQWKLLEEEDDYFVVKKGDDILCLTAYYWNMMIVEDELWHKCYLPSFSLKGKTVLDVGSGCGETVRLFHKAGASRIVAIEPNEEACALLQKNSVLNGWKTEVVNDAFRLEHYYRYNYDYMKMDGEGCEAMLLQLDKLIPCIVEAHSTQIAEKLEKRFKMKKVHQHTDSTSLLSNIGMGQSLVAPPNAAERPYTIVSDRIDAYELTITARP